MSGITREFIVDRINAGASQSALCAATGLSRSKLKALLAYLGIVMQGGDLRKLPPIADLVARIESGEHCKSIAAEYSVSVPAVYRAVERGGTSVKALRAGDHNKRGRMGFPPGTLTLRGNPDLGGTK